MVVHGLAASIRAARENEVFDLGGQTAATIESTIQAAFAEPFEGLDEMIRITLVTGAVSRNRLCRVVVCFVDFMTSHLARERQGKQARQKYDEQAHKAVMTALQQVGYTEDRTASGVMECAGMYKLQHDTGKNLKTVVVYPRVVSAKSSTRTDPENKQDALIPEHAPGYKLAVAPMPTFQNIIKSKCPSWSQKKGCLECLDALTDIIQSLDDKLMHGQPLSETEQSFYSVVSQLEDKKEYLRHESKQQVEEGQITELEKELLVEHNAQRRKEAPDNTNLLERKKLLESIDPIEPAKLKHHAAISKLQKEVAQLLHLNENQLLSVKERQLVTRREQIWEEIAEWQDASRGWFEEDNIFEARIKASQQGLEKFRSSANKSSSGSTKASGNSSADAKLKSTGKGGAGSKWILPSDQKGGKKKKGSRSSGPGVFDAMRLRQGDDSSSESSSEEEEEEEASTRKATNPPTQSPKLKDSSKAASGGGNQTKSKKSKKKKKKGAAKADTDASDDALLESTSRQVAAANPKEETNDITVFGQCWRFLQAYVFPLFLALLTWFAGLFFGKPKTKAKKS